MRKKRLFFLHIPNTGGTTLEQCLRRHFADADICAYHEPDEWDQVDSKEAMAPFRLYTGRSRVEHLKLLPSRTLTVTLLHDPIDLCISGYNRLRLDPDSTSYGDFQERQMNFDTYLDEVLPAMSDLDHYPQTLSLLPRDILEQVRAETEFDKETEVTILKHSAYFIQLFDVVGFTDNLQAAYDRICKAMKWKHEQVPELNASKKWIDESGLAVSREQLGEDQLKKIRRCFPVELELFNFIRKMENAAV